MKEWLYSCPSHYLRHYMEVREYFARSDKITLGKAPRYRLNTRLDEA